MLFARLRTLTRAPRILGGKTAAESPETYPDSAADASNDSTLPPLSFKSRLKLQEYMFTRSAGLRRSPRLSATPSESDAAVPSPARAVPLSSSSSSLMRRSTPTKRKALAAAAAADADDETPPSASSSPSEGSPSRNGKAKRQKSGYAPPSMYAHLPHLPDAIAPNLLVLFVGLNPGIQTAQTGHAYAHPTNLFWRLLHSSGVTPRLCSPTEDRNMPALYSLGLTNIVSRPSRNGAELSKKEMDAGVAILETKARRWRPESMCVVGKGIWESLWRVRHGRAIRADEFRYGWQDESENIGVIGEDGPRDDEVEEGVHYSGEWKGARVFVASSTSGLAATLSPQEKQRIWMELGSWVEKRREERAAAEVKP